MTLDAHKDWVGGANSLLCGGVVGELTRSLRLPNAASLMMDTASFLFLVVYWVFLYQLKRFYRRLEIFFITNQINHLLLFFYHI